MITDNLYNEVLIQPALNGADELLIVSGFATASMVDKHRHSLSEKEKFLPINLIVGMVQTNGIEKVQHKGFQRIAGIDNFKCYYLVNKSCHAKIFIWLNKKQPIKAFLGSANYTINGFGRYQIECMDSTDPMQAKKFYDNLIQHSALCTGHDIENRFRIKNPIQNRKFEQKDMVTLPLIIKKTGETHTAGGLNWGQREGREQNQAYIPIPSQILRSNFFPPRKQEFTVLTDDDESFTMVVAQMEGKALHTPTNNSTLGLYFRNRLGLKSGEYVTREHLDRYGSTTVDFYRLEGETYYMVFLPDAG